MSFSNGGLDTFEPRKGYVGVRLQQGVPLLDRDWNEMEDIRRWFERTLREHYIGPGVPDVAGFAVSAPEIRADDDVVIGAGRCMVDGYDAWNADELLFSEQGDRVSLPPALADRDDVLTVYLDVDVVRVDATTDPDLRNGQDINLETCVRDQLRWSVRAVREPELAPPGSVVLAVISRPAGTTRIRDDMIADRRRVLLNLAETVDRVGRAEERLGVLEAVMQRAQLDIETLKQQLGRLFWDVKASASTADSLFGGKVAVTATVTDRLGTPIRGATLAFSADWGTLSSTVAVTDARGVASVDIVGVTADTPVREADIGLLGRISQKVVAATLPNPGAVEYAKLKFEPEELSVVSRYSPPTMLADIGNDIALGPIVARPYRRTATVTIHAKEGAGAIVRGVGSVQVNFGNWVRDYVRTKIADVTRSVQVGARIGDVLRRGLDDQRFDHVLVADELLPVTLQSIQDDTSRALKEQLFVDPDLADDRLQGVGLLGQVIAQEATAAVGGQTNAAITFQIQQFVDTPSVPLDEADGRAARERILQKSSQLTAGFAQGQRQQFAGAIKTR